jgi:Tfp pilus assembly protein PilN
VRAIDLIPASERTAAGRSGGGPYVLLGALALLLLGVTLNVLTGNTIAERRDELATVRTRAQAAQVQAEARRPYVSFAALAQARVATVRQLGATRFDWEDALADLSKVIPSNVWLQSLLGTVTTGVTVEGGASGALRSASTNPAIELTGCTESHEDVARLISRLRLMDGVDRVALADSTKDEDSGGDCAGFPRFNLAIFFEPLATVAAPVQPVPATAPASTPEGTTPPPSGVVSGSGGNGGAVQ